MTSTEEAADRSRQLLHRALHPEGFLASPSLDHYAAIWARDAAMACLGASRTGEETLLAGAETTLRTLARLATPLGQIPDAYWPGRGYWDWGEAGTVDASAWFVIALAEHVDVTGRETIGTELWDSARRALTWLRYQDATGTGLVDSPAGGDWMDSSLNRSGRVFHVNVLYHWAATGAERLAERLGTAPPLDPGPIAASLHALFWPEAGRDLAELNTAAYPEDATVVFPHPLSAGEYARLATADRRHYLASIAYGRFVDRCDVLAHCLAIAGGLIGGERADLVLGYLAETDCAVPYPTRTWPEPFVLGEAGGMLDTDADALQAERWRNPPGSYHNGAVWPYIGAVHSVAAARTGRHDDARGLLERVAGANALDDWAFPEWIEVSSGEPGGARDQVWNAGAFLWAYSVISAGS